VIRWSDGTLSLRLGKELFDINQTIDTSGVFAGPIGGSQASQSQSQSQEPAASKSKSQGLTYLVAQHKRAQVLQAEAVITGYMTLRPTGMQSETHRMLVRAVGQKHNKVARLRMAPDPTKDPEREVAELSKLVAKKSKKKPTMIVVTEERSSAEETEDPLASSWTFFATLRKFATSLSGSLVDRVPYADEPLCCVSGQRHARAYDASQIACLWVGESCNL